ncbi:hypothetical protein ES703_26199 [subsurface metagenome]
MGMEIPGITGGNLQDHRVANSELAQEVKTPQTRLNAHNEAEIQRLLDILEKTVSLFNKRLKFSINREINRIVVKVIDGTTDKVIKEIPPEEIQRLVAGIKEMIGLLVDERI